MLCYYDWFWWCSVTIHRLMNFWFCCHKKSLKSPEIWFWHLRVGISCIYCKLSLCISSCVMCFDVWCVTSNANTVATSMETAVPSDTVDLQVDYWMSPPRSDPQERGDRMLRKEVKCSLKTMFRSMRVFRMLPTGAALSAAATTADTTSSPMLSMIVVIREKKQKSTLTCFFPV